MKVWTHNVKILPKSRWRMSASGKKGTRMRGLFGAFRPEAEVRHAGMEIARLGNNRPCANEI